MPQKKTSSLSCLAGTAVSSQTSSLLNAWMNREDNQRSRRWGLVLAGGDGTRLQTLTRFLCGDDRPKQFCPLFDDHSLLKLTLRRVERSIASEQVVVAVTRGHQDYYLRDLKDSNCTRLVQPCNKGTALPILYSLLQIAQENQGALVAIFPSDHYYSDEPRFTETLEAAFDIADGSRQSVVLLGAKPSGPETEFGWIEVGDCVRKSLYRVRGFQEKPSLPIAKSLYKAGGLWNTFVMVGHVQAFLQMAWDSSAEILLGFQRTLPQSFVEEESRIPDAEYSALPNTDFSRDILSPSANYLLTMRLEDLEWHDLGRPDRVVSILLNQKHDPPAWVDDWQNYYQSLKAG